MKGNSALEADQVGAYKTAFEAANPDIEIAWVRDSTGVITARFLAEKDNPRADVIWGLGASSVALFDSMGLLEPYAPKGLDQIKPTFRSAKNPPGWTGMDAWLAAMCFNTVEGGKKNLPKPAAWTDLTNPVYKDSVVMPNPASSGTGYQAVYAWIQIMGEKAAWEFMDKLHQNVAVGLGPIEISVPDITPTDRFITILYDMRQARQYTRADGVEVRVYAIGEGGPAAELHVAIEPGLLVARQGAGGVHHVAFRAKDDAEYAWWVDRYEALGLRSSGPVDRFYFKSLYIREPNGILFEIATDGPGFATDEPLETMGESLSLPPFLEHRRVEIEGGLTTLRR